MLERGLGCIQNYSKAAFWYEEAAKRGHIQAFNNLGVLYKDGLGVKQDDNRCFICFVRASEGGLTQGHYNLGLLYDQGVGCEQDNDKALDLCRKAAYAGHEKAKEIIKALQEDTAMVETQSSVGDTKGLMDVPEEHRESYIKGALAKADSESAQRGKWLEMILRILD